MNPFVSFVALLSFIISVDFIMLSFVLKNSFAKELTKFQRTIRPASALISWFLMTVGIYVFVAPWSGTVLSSALFGAFFGLILYGVYDFTNYAIFKNYTKKMIVIDVAWGILLCSVSSIFLFFVKTL